MKLWKRRQKSLVDDKRLLSLMGFATRAREAVNNEFSTEKSVKSGKPHLVIVSEKAPDNTERKFTNMRIYYKVPIHLFGTKDELGHAMGQEFRVSLPVKNAGFARSMVERVNINGGSLDESK